MHQVQEDKLMQSNRPQAKICFKSYFNRLLIDPFDPNLKPDFYSSRQNRLNRVRLKSKKSI